MNDLVDRIVATTGLERSVAERAIGIIVGFLGREGPQPQVQEMIDSIPGARGLAEQYGGTGTGLMGVYGDLTATGLGMGQIQSVARAVVDDARATVGEKKVAEVVDAIPGLSQFV